MALRTRSLHRWIAAIAVATHALVALPGGALAQPASAKEALANADKAAKAKDWAKAQSEYRAAYQAAPTAQALNGLASASYELGAWGEAYEAYDEFLKTYPDAMGRGAKALAEKRVKELDAKTGALTILVNEGGADVSLDDKKIGASPVRALIRVGTGAHSLKVSKAGFAAFEKSVDVAPGAKVSVDVNLVKGAKTGKLTVKEAGGQAVRVFVDNVDMGPAPWTGDVDPGSHQVRVQSGTLGSTSQKVEVEAGKTGEVTIAATSASGRLSIATSDGLGVIYVDGKVVGEGQFSGDVPAGSHDVRITREGFVPFEKRYEVGDKQSVSETVPLKTAGQSLDAVKVEEERAFYGMYGGFGLLGGIGVGGLGSSLDLTSDSCQKTLGAVSCDTPGPMGGGAFGYVGFTWLPVGIELFVGGLFDQAKQTATFGASDQANTPLLGPARTEEFTFIRFGGVGAIRARATLDGKNFRASLSAGPGVSYKQIIMQRKSASVTGGYSERYVPDDGANNPGESQANKLNYVSPALVADLAVHWRMGQTTALSLGLLGWLETAGNDVAAQPDRTRLMVSDQQGNVPLHIPTPRYEPASGAQFFLGPYLGMMFGP